jgi:hypothetical protein
MAEHIPEGMQCASCGAHDWREPCPHRKTVWAVGDRGYWLAVEVPGGATWNPPPPGWKPPTKAELEHQHMLNRSRFVTIEEVGGNGLPIRARGDDGFIFDPSVDIDCLHGYVDGYAERARK